MLLGFKLTTSLNSALLYSQLPPTSEPRAPSAGFFCSLPSSQLLPPIHLPLLLGDRLSSLFCTVLLQPTLR